MPRVVRRNISPSVRRCTAARSPLAALLIVGFALHNATKGFGIVGPLAGAGVRASWGWLALAGLIGGGPTFLGTIVGTSFDSLLVYVGCLAVAAGAILYVIGELLPAGRRLSWEVTLWGLLAAWCSAWPRTWWSPPAVRPGPGSRVDRPQQVLAELGRGADGRSGKIALRWAEPARPLS